MTPLLTCIVQRALRETVTDMGQLSRLERLSLERAVRHGVLAKGKGGPFPILKTVYAVPSFDFAADREAARAELWRAHELDLARGTAHFFPWVEFRKDGQLNG